jgi:hypothetical protein
MYNLLYTLGSEEEGKDSNENNNHENYDDTGKKIHCADFSSIFPLLRLPELQGSAKFWWRSGSDGPCFDTDV